MLLCCGLALSTEKEMAGFIVGLQSIIVPQVRGAGEGQGQQGSVLRQQATVATKSGNMANPIYISQLTLAAFIRYQA
jgi:hypothetical protein